MKFTKQQITGKPLAWLLTLIYFSSYITRKNFAAVLQQVISETGIAKDTLSVVLVSMTVAYGLGQIINGRLGDKFNPTNIIFVGIIIATAVNLFFPFSSGSVALMSILWAINGFAQSMMWPPIVKILVSVCDDEMYSYSTIRVSWGSSFATIALYFIAPLVISLTGSWKAMFYFSASVGLLISVLWFYMKGRIPKDSAQQGDCAFDTPTAKAKFSVPKSAIFPMVFIILGIIFQGMLRDGIATWMPTYLADVHEMSNQESILSGVFPAIFSGVSVSLINVIYRRFFSSEVTCAAVIFGTSVLASGVLLTLFGKSTVVAIICMTLITGCMHGINLMLISYVPKRFKKYGNISTFAGLVNACTYVGEAIFIYGIALIADKYDWRTSIGVCLAIATLGAACCLIAVRPWRKFTEE